MADEDGQWYWNACSNPFDKNAVPDWKPYDSSDNNKIEQAFKAGKNKADLANHAIHLKERMQVHKADFNKQRPVKREVKT
ncbi:unnamed protein product [Adineta ricciae]|uniref:WWE domain-containing protein n=1 Tax=Adineta ricciae TaxID=249248 RepID=A0A814APV7_ADIRI|nr:unnamed protein product [Adineta ricciae]